MINEYSLTHSQQAEINSWHATSPAGAAQECECKSILWEPGLFMTACSYCAILHSTYNNKRHNLTERPQLTKHTMVILAFCLRLLKRSVSIQWEQNQKLVLEFLWNFCKKCDQTPLWNPTYLLWSLAPTGKKPKLSRVAVRCYDIYYTSMSVQQRDSNGF